MGTLVIRLRLFAFRFSCIRSRFSQREDNIQYKTVTIGARGSLVFVV